MIRVDSHDPCAGLDVYRQTRTCHTIKQGDARARCNREPACSWNDRSIYVDKCKSVFRDALMSAHSTRDTMFVIFRSNCLVEGGTRALSLRRAFASVRVDHSQGSAATCLSQDLVEEICLAVGTGWIDSEPAQRAAWAEGGHEVVLDPQADITLSGPLRLADGTTLHGGTLRDGGGRFNGLLEVGRGVSARIEGVAILDSQGHGIDVDGGGVIAVQSGRIARSRSSGVGVDGAGSRAGLTGVVVKNSGGDGIWAVSGGVVSLQGGSVTRSERGDYSESGGRIEQHCPCPDHAGEQHVRRSELGGARGWCRATRPPPRQ